MTENLEGLNESEVYFNNYEYNFYPLLGVTQEQASAYSKWRSDRVFEGMLIQSKIISINTNQTKENHFTINKYLNGEIEKKKTDIELNYFPEFRLPSREEWMEISERADMLFNEFKSNCRNKKCNECIEEYPIIWMRKGDGLVTRKVAGNYMKNKYDLIYNIKGNVSEWIDISGNSAGGSYKDSQNQLDAGKFEETNLKANNWTGFRNVCSWKNVKIFHKN